MEHALARSSERRRGEIDADGESGFDPNYASCISWLEACPASNTILVMLAGE